MQILIKILFQFLIFLGKHSFQALNIACIKASNELIMQTLKSLGFLGVSQLSGKG